MIRRGLRLLSVFFLAALVLVPLVESGHSHGARDMARPCAVCVVAHHAPAATTAAVAPVAGIAPPSTAVVSLLSSPVRVDRTPQSGRAPPVSSPEQVA